MRYKFTCGIEISGNFPICAKYYGTDCLKNQEIQNLEISALEIAPKPPKTGKLTNFKPFSRLFTESKSFLFENFNFFERSNFTENESTKILLILDFFSDFSDLNQLKGFFITKKPT